MNGDRPHEYRPAFGQRVVASEKAIRRNEYINGKKWRVWKRQAGMISGLYIGYRTVFDGLSWWESDEVGNVFAPERHYELWLLVPNDRQNPVYVFPDGVMFDNPAQDDTP